MNDEYFGYFLSKFGEPTAVIPAKKEQIESYRGVLPDKLLEYWSMVGFSGFQDGLFWITNPAGFDDALEAFIRDTDFVYYDNCQVFARSAYGELYLWGERTGASLSIIPHLNWIKTMQGSEKAISCGDIDISIQRFIGFKESDDIDIKSNSKPLFPSVLKKHGSVGKDEVMVFTPYLFMGGKKSVNYMSKENLHIFLQVMAELGGAEIVDMASMVKNVVKHYSSL